MPELVRFQELRGKINSVMLNLLNDCLKPTKKMVSNLVMVQNGYINTYHPDFIGTADMIFGLMDPVDPPNQDDQIDSLATPKKIQDEIVPELETKEQREDGIKKSDLTVQKTVTGNSGEFPDLSPMGNADKVKDLNNYEVNKYMQKNVKPIRMPHMTNFKRAEDHDPGQTSQKSTMEINMIKNLIVE